MVTGKECLIKMITVSTPKPLKAKSVFNISNAWQKQALQRSGKSSNVLQGQSRVEMNSSGIIQGFLQGEQDTGFGPFSSGPRRFHRS